SSAPPLAHRAGPVVQLPCAHLRNLHTTAWRTLVQIPLTHASPDGLISLVIDARQVSYHLTAMAGHQASSMAVMLGVATLCGLEPLDDGEAEPELLDDGGVRVYLATASEPEVVYARALAALRPPRGLEETA